MQIRIWLGVTFDQMPSFCLILLFFPVNFFLLEAAKQIIVVRGLYIRNNDKSGSWTRSWNQGHWDDNSLILSSTLLIV